MTSLSDLAGIEFDYVVSDLDEHVAVLSHAGFGPIPLEIGRRIEVEIERVQRLAALTPTGRAVRGLGFAVRAWSRKLDDSFWRTLAERGVYGFDWQTSKGPYRRLVRPSRPRLVTDLTRALGDAPVLRLPVRFGRTRAIRLRALGVPCHD